MKITKQHLRQIIKEEVTSIDENFFKKAFGIKDKLVTKGIERYRKRWSALNSEWEESGQDHTVSDDLIERLKEFIFDASRSADSYEKKTTDREQLIRIRQLRKNANYAKEYLGRIDVDVQDERGKAAQAEKEKKRKEQEEYEAGQGARDAASWEEGKREHVARCNEKHRPNIYGWQERRDSCYEEYGKRVGKTRSGGPRFSYVGGLEEKKLRELIKQVIKENQK